MLSDGNESSDDEHEVGSDVASDEEDSEEVQRDEVQEVEVDEAGGDSPAQVRYLTVTQPLLNRYSLLHIHSIVHIGV
jgi:hypothetical protein